MATKRTKEEPRIVLERRVRNLLHKIVGGVPEVILAGDVALIVVTARELCKKEVIDTQLDLLQKRHDFAAAGLCQICGCNPAIPGEGECEACREGQKDIDQRIQLEVFEPPDGKTH